MKTKYKLVGKIAASFSTTMLAALLTACGGGGGTAATSSLSSSALTGIASKGIISGATVTAYCGGSKANVVIGTATTDTNGNYSITPSTTCSLPVEVVLTPKAGATMFDEATNQPVPLPASFKMRAYIANPSTTLTTNITPFSDMAASVIDASSTSPNAANVDAAINAVIAAALGGDDQLYNAKPMKPTDAAASDDTEVKKLSALLTAISAHANSLVLAKSSTDTGTATLLALEELDKAATSTITISADNASIINPPSGILSPADILNQDITDAQNSTDDPNMEAETIASSAPTLVVPPPGIVIATTPGIASAKTLFTNLRTNLVLLSNSTKTGFVDNEVSSMKTSSFQGLGRTVNNVDAFGSAASHASYLLQNASTLTYTNGLAYYNSKGSSCSIAYGASQVSCNWGGMYNATTGAFAIHQTIFTLASTGSLNWSDQLQNASGVPTGSTYPGTVTSSGTNGTNAVLTFNGTVAGLDLTAVSSQINNLSGMESISGANTILALTGNVVNYDGSNNALLTLSFRAGSQIVGTTPTATAPSQPVSANIAVNAVTPAYSFAGMLTITNFVHDISGQYVKPGSVTFTGSITDLIHNATSPFITGKLTETTDLSAFDGTQPLSPTNFPKHTFGFAGTLVNFYASPVMTYTVNLTDDETVYGQRGLTFTYTDPNNNSVTISQNGYAPTTITATSNGVTVVYIKGTGGKVFSGDPTVPENQIGTISPKVVSFDDGSFFSL